MPRLIKGVFHSVVPLAAPLGAIAHRPVDTRYRLPGIVDHPGSDDLVEIRCPRSFARRLLDAHHRRRRQARLAPVLGHHPGKQQGRGIGVLPDAMSARRVFGVDHPRIGVAQGIDLVARTGDADGAVVGRVEIPERNGAERCRRSATITGHRHRAGKTVGPVLDELPGAVAAHRQAGHMDAIRVDVELRRDAIEHGVQLRQRPAIPQQLLLVGHWGAAMKVGCRARLASLISFIAPLALLLSCAVLLVPASPAPCRNTISG